MRSFIRTLAALACALPLVSRAQAQADCDLHYRIVPRYDSTPRRLDVELSFPSEGRRESWLRIQAAWAGVNDFGAFFSAAESQPAGTQLLPGDNSHRWKVAHGGDGQVRVAFQIRAALPDPDDGKVQQQDQLYRTQIGTNWFQFFGYGALPSVEAWGDDRPGRMCVSIQQPETSAGPLLGSHFDGRAQASAQAQLQGGHALLRHAFYAGGPGWRVSEKRLASGPVVVASRGVMKLDDQVLADQVAGLLDAHRRFWGDQQAPRQTVVLTPNNSQGNNGGTLVHQTAVLHGSTDFGPGNDSFEFLIGHENLHQWLPHRLGGRFMGEEGQAALNYWLSEGFTDYYTHRLLLASGLWDLERYATQVTRALRGYWRSPARNAPAASIAPRFFSDRDAGRQMYSRGEILAMRWDRALRQRGHAGLDALLRGQLLSLEDAAKAEPAHVRVLQALGKQLGTMATDDVRAHVDEGRSLDLDERLAGPCFALRWDDVPRWTLGFDPASFKSYTATGVVVDGPAYRAGLREGMALKGWSVYGNDLSKEVVLQLKSEEGPRELRYLPVGSQTERLPTVSVRPGASTDAACQAWIRR